MPVIALSTERAWFDDGDGVAYKYLQPIPLTEEVLTACGFAKSALGYALLTHKHKRVSLRWIKRASLTDDRELDKPFARYNEVADIYYLHQLQNLYFALTGSELEVSLPIKQ